jgi:methoxymalonate biosynthesis acyl carrier protein
MEDCATMDKVKEKLRAYFSRIVRGESLQDDTDIFATGFVNSLIAMQLVMFVEKEFSITIENEDLELKHFNSIDAITELVKRRAAVKV